jgi:signal transduction histidine kinase
MHSPEDASDALRLELNARAGQAVLARAAQESQRKDMFIATVAHELRNMMAPLDSALEILDRARHDPELVGRALPVARRQVRHLCHLVDDLLDIGRIVNDQVVLDRKVLVLQQLVEEAAAACDAMIAGREQHLTLRLDSDPARIRGDALRWAQITTNLLHNASKFTPVGGTIQVSVKVDTEGRTAELRVADNGCGIARGDLESIFGMFQRERRSRAKPGLGIGLAVVRRLVELHGGTIRAESAGPNRGSTFVVRLPVLPEAPRACAAAIRITRP